MKIKMMICAAAVVVCRAMYAQSASAVDRVTVRFAAPVQIGQTPMPAGDCSIQVIRGSGDNLMLAMRSDSGVAVYALVNRINEPIGDIRNDKDAQVILSRHGNQVRLERIVMPDHSGFEVLPTQE